MTKPESYTLTEHGVTRGSDHASIPDADGNRDWRAYQEWLTDGNKPDPLPVVVVDPTIAEKETTKLAAKDKLVGLGLTEPEASVVARVEPPPETA